MKQRLCEQLGIIGMAIIVGIESAGYDLNRNTRLILDIVTATLEML